MTTATEPAAGKKSTAAAPATVSISITLDPETYLYFEKKAKEDDRTVSKYVARTLRTYVLQRTEPAQGEVKKKDEEF